MQQSNSQDSEIKFHDSVWSWPDASAGQRAAAFVIDTVLLGVLYGLLGALTQRFFGFETPTSIRSLIGFVYFIALETRSGQTLGKKIVGIRIVPLEPEPERLDDGLPLGTILRRESLGRFLCAITLFYGYLRILTRSDRMGLHDSLARTRVVSLSVANATPIRLKHVLGGVLALLLLGGGGFYYVKNYTAYPLRGLARQLEPIGIHIEGVNGNLARGFTIDRITQTTDDYEYEVRGVSFHYNKESRASERKFVVEDLTIENARFNLLRLPQASGTALPRAVKKVDEGPFGGTSEVNEVFSGILQILSIDINNVEVTIPNRTPYHLHRLFLSDFIYKSAPKSMEFERLYVSSDTIVLDLNQVFAEPKRVSFGRPAYVQIRPAAFPDLLRSAVDFQFEGLFEDKAPSMLKLSGFSNRLRVDLKDSAGELNLTNFTLGHYFKTDLPLWNLNLKIAGDLKSSKIQRVQGSVGIRSARFDLETFALAHIKGSRTFALSPRLSVDWREMLAGRDPGFVLGSSDRMKAKDALADLYFGKPAASLDASARSIVESDQRFFTDALDAGPSLAPLAVAPLSVAKPVVKAEVKSTTRTPSSLPRKLPPFKAKRRQSG